MAVVINIRQMSDCLGNVDQLINCGVKVITTVKIKLENRLEMFWHTDRQIIPKCQIVQINHIGKIACAL